MYYLFKFLRVQIVLVYLLTFQVFGIRDDECIEVGFARSTFTNVEQGYGQAKENLLDVWAKEDKNGLPAYRQFGPQYKNVTRAAVLLEETSKNIVALIRKSRVGKRCSPKFLMKGMEKHVTPVMKLEQAMADDLGLIMSFRCLVGSPFPNVDGTCNHEKSPDMGAIGSKLLRLLPVETDDTGLGLRPSTNASKDLPSAREVAQFIRKHWKRPKVTALFEEMSHFAALDTINIPESPSTEDIDCCQHPDLGECAPIFVSKDDPLYSKYPCLNFRRSAPAQAILGHRDFVTMVSTYFDMNPVYGVTNEEAFDKKENYLGYIKYPVSSEDKPKNEKKSTCKFPVSFDGCFGLNKEEKIEFREGLSLLLILEHNYVADKLLEVNPHFHDSLLYNEARRIVIAEYNAILYGEFVPKLIGTEMAQKHDLIPGSKGLASHFIDEVNPGLLNCHAVASYWNPSMKSEWNKGEDSIEFVSQRHYEGAMSQGYVDLLAMDVQRGRDHVVPGYEAWRRFCNEGKSVERWEDVAAVFGEEIAGELKMLYQGEIKDMDLILALLEHPEEDGVVGKIFTCILADQYSRLKTGNRLFWEFDSSLLTVEQRDAIRTQSSAGPLLCRHLTLDKIPRDPFRPVAEDNPEIECSSFSDLDLNAWKDVNAEATEDQPQQEFRDDFHPTETEEIIAETPEQETTDQETVLEFAPDSVPEGGTEPLPVKRTQPKKKDDSGTPEAHPDAMKQEALHENTEEKRAKNEL